MLYIPILLGIILFLLIKHIRYQWKVRSELPPGPFPLPLIGNLPMMLSKRPFYETVMDLTAKYGDVMTIWIGWRPAVVLSSVDAIRKAVIDDQHNFASRPDNIFSETFMEKSQDIIFAKYNQLWHQHKKLANRAMRSIIGTDQLENHVELVVKETCDRLEKMQGPIKLETILNEVVFTVIYFFCYGKHLSPTHPEFQQRIELAEQVNRLNDAGAIVDALPFRDWIPWEKIAPPLRRITKNLMEQKKFGLNHFKQHKETFTPGKVRDIMDALITELKAMQSEGENVHFNEDHAALIMFDIVLAGTETTRRTLHWFFLLMTVFPDIQEKCAQQIQEVIGDQPPKLNDRPNLPLVEAALLETLRFRTIVPLGVPHAPTTDGAMLFGKYKIPKEGQIIINQFALHMSPEYWKNPREFDPGHFLDSDGVVKKPAFFQPFGVGRRVCLGETLAKNDLFLIVSGLLQKLKFKPVPGSKYSIEPSDVTRFAIFQQPFEVLVEKRQ